MRRRAVSNVGVGALDEPQDGSASRTITGADGGDVPSRWAPTANNYLRVTASYNDGHGQGAKTLSGDLRVCPRCRDQSLEQHAAGVPEPPVRGRRRPASRSDENATARNGRRPGASRRPTRKLGTLRLLPRGLPASPPIRRSRSIATSSQIRVAGGAALDHEDPDHDRYSVTVTAEDEYDRHGNGHVRHHH